MDPVILIPIIAVVAIIVLAVFLRFVPIGMWFKALISGVRVSLGSLIGMRLRGVAPQRMVYPLIKANKEFELVVIPGAHHTVGEAYGEHKRYDFFVRHLLGVNPPAWNELEKKQNN